MLLLLLLLLLLRLSLLLGFGLTGFLVLFLYLPTVQKADLVKSKGALPVDIEAVKKASWLTYVIVDTASAAKLLLGHLFGIVFIKHLKRGYHAPEFFRGPSLEFHEHAGGRLVKFLK